MGNIALSWTLIYHAKNITHKTHLMSHNSWSKKIPSQHFLPNRQQPNLWKIEWGYIHDFFADILLNTKLFLIKLGLSEKHTNFEKIFLMVWTYEEDCAPQKVWTIKNSWVNMSPSFGDPLIILKKNMQNSNDVIWFEFASIFWRTITIERQHINSKAL